MKFLPEQFTSFDPNENRISQEVLSIITKDVGCHYFSLNLFGVDILVQEETGHVYLIDINYFSSYDGLKSLDVKGAFRDLLRKVHKANVDK